MKWLQFLNRPKKPVAKMSSEDRLHKKVINVLFLMIVGQIIFFKIPVGVKK
jgi:hypothetical protein